MEFSPEEINRAIEETRDMDPEEMGLFMRSMPDEKREAVFAEVQRRLQKEDPAGFILGPDRPLVPFVLVREQVLEMLKITTN